MALAGDPISENTALLSLLGPVLEPVTEHEIPHRNKRYESSYPLIFKHEKQLAQAFALILVNTDDPKRVGAVCIEVADGGHLQLRTAVNSGTQENRKIAFHKVMNHLNCDNVTSNSLLNEMIDVCRLKLLSRLCSHHAPNSRKSNRQPIIRKLHEFVRLFDKIRKAPSELIPLTEHTSSLVQDFDRIEEMSASEAKLGQQKTNLFQIIHRINDMLAEVDLLAVLGLLMKHAVVPNLTEITATIRRFKQLQQYLFAARTLVSLIQKYPIIRNMTIQGVELGPFMECNQGPQPSGVRSGLFRRTLASKKSKVSRALLRHIYKELQTDQAGILENIDRFSERDKLVHAEIQLLFQYEDSKDDIALPPRVICSSKHACFSCNLFLRVHGRFYTPGTHGRLYEPWRLPHHDELGLPEESINGHLVQFNNALEDRIKTTLKSGKSKLAYPCESTIFHLGSQASSVLSVHRQAPPRAVPGAGQDQLENEDSNRSLVQPEPVSTSPKQKPSSDHGVQPVQTEISPSVYLEDTDELSDLASLPTVDRIGNSKIIDVPEPVDQPAIPQRLGTCRSANGSFVSILYSPKSRISIEKTHPLILGPPLILRVAPEQSVRVHSPRIHMELTSGDGCTFDDTYGEVSVFIVNVELLEFSQALERYKQQDMVDLSLPHECPESFHDIREQDLVLRKRQDVVVIRVQPE
ncbi:hypothetical protein P152DRAFT_302886 [Eremomyces bilateralis CBS 781.70]|uniref:Uncharacterized protein n=1 Tax=Eremomyces bilateralis CBS 781.70 TaxID=1392243 RepID=A0A6G1G840_9PEZI|nr:uncharacterized protein P152DRAFT_302886 [Eremomyces bilateralis CBS 781.70]KAF1814060.1 hypothetical protein P152DRAFT_302886 [Eremomyces bilateralis CBS 781.70]